MTLTVLDESLAIDVAVIGGGAAGLAAAIFVARRLPARRVVIFDGAGKLGAKILVAGGGRCNVTNRVVTAADFWGGKSNHIKRVLAAMPVDRTVAFFREIGVGLREEEDGKLFPDTNKARTVLDALLAESDRLGVRILTGHRVTAVTCGPSSGFSIQIGDQRHRARFLILATGGKSLPKTGSDGGGYLLARSLGHSLVEITPALAPLILDGDFHQPLTGIAQDVELTTTVEGAKPVRLRGALLWTHFGVSGPVVLNASRHWHRARLEKRSVRLTANLLPGEDFPSAERCLMNLAAESPKSSLVKMLSRLLPARVAEAVLNRIDISPAVPMAHLSRDQRRRLVHALLAWPLPVRDSRGYAHAEVTAGGVPLDEIDTRTMTSRKCPGLYLVGEILDVDGRIGGFNFQWAWSSAHVAAEGIARNEKTVSSIV